MSGDSSPRAWQRCLGLFGVTMFLSWSLIANGGTWLISEMTTSYRLALVPLLAALIWLILSLRLKAPYERASWWKGFFLVLLLASCLHLVLDLRLFTLPQLPSAPEQYASLLPAGFIVLLVYFIVSHVLVSYASSRTHYDPSELSAQEMVIGLAFSAFALLMALLFVTKETSPRELSLKADFTPLTLEVKEPTGFFRRGQHLIVASRSGLHHSYDGGNSWSLQGKAEGLVSNQVRKLYAHADRLLLVLDSDGEQRGGIMESRDQGKSWQLLPYPKDSMSSGDAWKDLVCDRQGYCVYSYTSGIQHAATLGPNSQDFRMDAGPSEPYKNTTLYLTSAGNRLYRADSTGIWRSQDEGRKWEWLPAGQEVDLEQMLQSEITPENAEGEGKAKEDKSEQRQWRLDDRASSSNIVGLTVKGDELCLIERTNLKHSKDQGLHWTDSSWHSEISRFVAFGRGGFGVGRKYLLVFPGDCAAPEYLYDESYGRVMDVLDGQEQALIVAEQGFFLSSLLAK